MLLYTSAIYAYKQNWAKNNMYYYCSGFVRHISKQKRPDENIWYWYGLYKDTDRVWQRIFTKVKAQCNAQPQKYP